VWGQCGEWKSGTTPNHRPSDVYLEVISLFQVGRLQKVNLPLQVLIKSVHVVPRGSRLTAKDSGEVGNAESGQVWIADIIGT
jgi:hypothetical protein